VEITVNEYKRVAVITVTGRVDSATATDFETNINEVVEKGKHNLVLDLSQVEFLSSAGLRVLVTTRKTLQGAGGNIVLAQPSERVVETLDTAGLDVLFERYDTREAAVAAF
jgi:anti-sigma B factor antagonist